MRGLFLLACVLAWGASAQTLQQAEALWRQGLYEKANTAFKAVCDGELPKDANCKVRYGRFFLDIGNAVDAGPLFDEALALDPLNAGAVLGKALIAADGFGADTVGRARKALELDPKLAEAHELLARLALEDDDRPNAIAEAKKAIELDAASVQGKAILATIDWLDGKTDTSWDPHAARGYETAGHFFMLNRRYDEAVAFYRKALALDPQLYPARSQLGINLMRLGLNEEAYQSLEDCFNNYFRDDATRNSLRLMDSYKNFVTFRTEHTILKLHKKEAGLLHPYFEEEMQRAIATYEKKYRFKLTQPVQIEVYPDHEDFAVRALGMPGLGALGVTFGYTIAMDSPSGRTPGEFHWASVMWHELSHVFTITMTNSRVPRWFTEGIAVHEETAASPEWGDRLGPEEIDAIAHKQLLPIADLDRGFIHPKSPVQVIVSYFQAGKICDYINDKWGWDTILAMLKDYGAGDDTPAVIRKELKIAPEDFDNEFLAHIEGQTKKTVDNFAHWRDDMKRLHGLDQKKDYDGVIQLGAEVRDSYPEYVEAGSAYEALARAYLGKENRAAAIAELERYVHAGGRNPESIKQLAEQLAKAGQAKEAAAILDRLNLIYPEDSELHQRLGALWLEQGNASGAVREFRAQLDGKPVDPAEAHFDLARAYRLDHRQDQARDEVLAALEIAPGFRPAQKLLLELQ